MRYLGLRWNLPYQITNLCVFGQIGSGKCLDEDTEIFVIRDDKIEITKLKNLDKVFDILSYNFKEKRIERKKGIILGGNEKDCYEIEMEDGSKIIASEDHKFFSRYGNEYTVKDIIKNKIDNIFSLILHPLISFKNKCIVCNKDLNTGIKFCSHECCEKYFRENNIGAFHNKEVKIQNGKKAAITNRMNRTSAYFDIELQKRHGRKAGVICRDRKIGIFGLSPERKKEIAIEAGKLGGKVTVERCKKNGTGIFSKESRKKLHIILKAKKVGFYNPETGRKAGKVGGPRAAITNKRNKTSAAYSFEIQSKAGKQNTINNKDKKLGYFSDESHRKGQETLRREQKSAFYNPKTRFEICSLAGRAGYESRIKNTKYYWEDVGFMSKKEMEVAKLILTKPLKNINCHVRIGGKYFDFYPQQEDKLLQNSFVEFHCFKDGKEIGPVYNSDMTYKEYFNSRRKVLDENGFKDVKLILLDSLQSPLLQNENKIN